MAKLASNPYLLVYSLPQEDHDDTDDASAGEVYAMFVSDSSVCRMQSSRRREHRPSVVDRHAPPIERLRCTAGGRACSAREGTLLARSKLPEDPVVRLLKGQRWGVCDAGTADMYGVDLKTVHRFQQVAAQRAETHHRQGVREVDGPGVQLDAAPSKPPPPPGGLDSYRLGDGELASALG
jgi:hypothetical protein